LPSWLKASGRSASRTDWITSSTASSSTQAISSTIGERVSEQVPAIRRAATSISTSILMCWTSQLRSGA
jgi:hypothetical protein